MSFLKPLHMFCTGGAGVGKSHLIKAIRHTSQKKLCAVTATPDDVVVLVITPTGTAAYKINGDTVHHALSLPVQKGTFHEYRPLSHEKRQSMFNRLRHLKYLIIDDLYSHIAVKQNEINKQIHSKVQTEKSATNQLTSNT